MGSAELVLREATVYDMEGKEAGKVQLPKFFSMPVRLDLIRRAFLAIFTSKLQPKGTDPLAGLRTTAESLGVGHGIARVARIKGGLRAARVPQAVKGRRAHPPKVEKIIKERINKKEKTLALASALAATASRELVQRRGHIVPEKQLPIIVTDDFERVSKASELRTILKNLGLWADVERAAERVRIRAGKGKMRGRRYKKPRSLLIVVADAKNLTKAAGNMPGVDVVSAQKLTVSHLAPGGVPGRLTVYTVGALKVLEERLNSVMVV